LSCLPTYNNNIFSFPLAKWISTHVHTLFWKRKGAEEKGEKGGKKERKFGKCNVVFLYKLIIVKELTHGMRLLKQDSTISTWTHYKNRLKVNSSHTTMYSSNSDSTTVSMSSVHTYGKTGQKGLLCKYTFVYLVGKTQAKNQVRKRKVGNARKKSPKVDITFQLRYLNRIGAVHGNNEPST